MEQDCAVLEPAKGDVPILLWPQITGTVKGYRATSVHITANDLAASGAEPLGIMVTILWPGDRGSTVKEMMRGELEAALLNS